MRRVKHGRTPGLVKITASLAATFLMTGCVSTYVGPATTPGQPAPIEEAEQPQATTTVPQTDIRPGDTDTYRASSAVQGLLTEGWKLFEQQRYDASASIAERALRIDRHNPEVYLLLSRSYLLQSQPVLAEQFARQGLAVAHSSTPVYRQLRELLQQSQKR